MATGQIGVGVLNVVLRSGNKNFVKSPYVLDVVGKLPHQNVKTVGVLDPGFVVIIAFLTNTRQATAQQGLALKVFHHSGSACCVCLVVAFAGWCCAYPAYKTVGPCKRSAAGQQPLDVIFPVAYSLRCARLYLRTGSSPSPAPAACGVPGSSC